MRQQRKIQYHDVQWNVKPGVTFGHTHLIDAVGGEQNHEGCRHISAGQLSIFDQHRMKTEQGSCNVGRAFIKKLTTEVVSQNYRQYAKENRKRAQREIAVTKQARPPIQHHIIGSRIAAIGNSRSHDVVECAV